MAQANIIKNHPQPLRQCPPRGRTAVALLTAVLLIAGLGTPACRQKTKTGIPGKKPDTGIHKTYERGPAECNVDVDRSEITIADRIHLAISVVIDEGYEVEFPPAGEKLAEFGIVDYHTSAPELTENGKKRISRSYVLEPFLSGDYTIPAMTVRFWKSGEKEKDVHTLQTDDITIKVTSLLPETLKDMKLHDIRPPVSLPRSMAVWVWAGGIGAGLIIAGLLCFYIYRKRRSAALIRGEIYLPPHEIAYAELERLVSKKLIDKGEIKPFYQEISNIMRRYIENRFGINAPEQTTEEFMEGLKGNSSFPAAYQGLLENFLTHCDLVKFAAHQPSTEDIQNTFNSCKRFIEETKTEDSEMMNS